MLVILLLIIIIILIMMIMIIMMIMTITTLMIGDHGRGLRAGAVPGEGVHAGLAYTTLYTHYIYVYTYMYMYI